MDFVLRDMKQSGTGRYPLDVIPPKPRGVRTNLRAAAVNHLPGLL